MNSPDEFDQMMGREFAQPAADPHPYGIPAQPVKTGLTPRGKAALGIGGAFIACGSLFGWQHYSAQQSANEVRAQEFTLLQQQLELEKLKEINKANDTAREQQTSENTARQKQIDACVKVNQSLVGKQLGVTYQSVHDDCQSKYPASVDTTMQAAADASGTGGTGEGGSSAGLLLGIGALALLGGGAATKKFTKSSTA